MLQEVCLCDGMDGDYIADRDGRLLHITDSIHSIARCMGAIQTDACFCHRRRHHLWCTFLADAKCAQWE